MPLVVNNKKPEEKQVAVQKPKNIFIKEDKPDKEDRKERPKADKDGDKKPGVTREPENVTINQATVT